MTQIPNYQKLLKPVLEFYGDSNEHALRDTAEYISAYLELTSDQQAIRTPTGAPVYVNRTSWAHTYLKQAGLIESVRRGVYRITDVGRAVLAENLDEITNSYLERFESFRVFKSAGTNSKQGEAKAVESQQTDATTPEERIQSAVKEHTVALRDEVLEMLRASDPFYFEKIVADLLEAMGYGIAEVTQRTNDGGIDAIINEDKLGISKIYAQAKRYSKDNRVNRKELQNFIGALEINSVTKGVFITTSDFYPQALEELKRTQKSIVLVNGERLAQLLIDYNLGVSIEESYSIKRLDIEYFDLTSPWHDKALWRGSAP